MKKSKTDRRTGIVLEIGEGVCELFSALNDAISEVASRIEKEQTDKTSDSRVFETPKAPLRAHAGINVRFAPQKNVEKKVSYEPVNTDRRAPSASQESQVRPLLYDLFEDTTRWIVTADLPGVSEGDVLISKTQAGIEIKATGNRKYHVDITLDGELRQSNIPFNLRNGVLIATIDKGTGN